MIQNLKIGDYVSSKYVTPGAVGTVKAFKKGLVYVVFDEVEFDSGKSEKNVTVAGYKNDFKKIQEACK